MWRTFFVAGFLALPLSTSATTVSFVANPQHIGVGDTVDLAVAVTSTTSLNTFSGAFIYPTDLFSAQSVRDGDSIATLWLSPPTLQQGSVSFAGFTPGGFSGSGALFHVELKALRAGDAQFSLLQPTFLKNDGHGTSENISVGSTHLAVSHAPVESFAPTPDTTPPAAFTPELGSHTNVFNGNAYLTFSTTDSGSGVDHYEVGEVAAPYSATPDWHEAQSPYELRDQTLAHDIYVKAVDRSGNARVEVFPHSATPKGYEGFVIGGMLIALFLIWVLSAHLLRKRRARSRV